MTITLAKRDAGVAPQDGFSDYHEIPIGSTKVVNARLGEGHTADNIIAYFPDEKVLFGGCLVKGAKAGRGNLNDANVAEWSKTVLKVKTKYPEAEVIIPGHGKARGQELLDYTIEMFLDK